MTIDWMNPSDDVLEARRVGYESGLAEREAEVQSLEQWVHDCQSGMWINCVYCGHRYGPKDEVKATMQETLYEHIAQCEKHPLSKAKNDILALRESLTTLLEVCRWKCAPDDEIVLDNGMSNEEAMIDAMRVLEATNLR